MVNYNKIYIILWCANIIIMYIIITHYCKLVRGQVNQFSILCRVICWSFDFVAWWTI